MTSGTIRGLALATALCAFTAPVLAKGGGGHASGSKSTSAGTSSGSSHSVHGYTRKDGTYVPSHRATNPDDTTKNNWTHKGNVNPYTGKEGTKEN
jgi:hypothetical protein